MPKPIYALVGEDSFLQLQKLREIRALFADDVQSLEFDGERAELAEVLDELRSFAMFGGGGKLVVIRNGDEFLKRFRDPLADYVAAPSDSGTLVLRVNSLPKVQRITKLIAKVGQIMECEPPKQAALPAWIINRGKTVHKLSVEPAAANLLAELIGDDLGKLDNELAKLALQVDAAAVKTEHILGSVSFQREQEIKDMTYELATGRPEEALRRWRHMIQLDKSAEFRAVTWLTMWLEDVGVVISGGNASQMAWKYRDGMSQFLKIANSLGKERYSKAITLLADMDRRSKSGLGDAAANVEQFILSFADKPVVSK